MNDRNVHSSRQLEFIDMAMNGPIFQNIPREGVRSMVPYSSAPTSSTRSAAVMADYCGRSEWLPHVQTD